MITKQKENWTVFTINWDNTIYFRSFKYLNIFDEALVMK